MQDSVLHLLSGKLWPEAVMVARLRYCSCSQGAGYVRIVLELQTVLSNFGPLITAAKSEGLCK